MKRHIFEILEEINNDPSKIIGYKNNTALKLVLKHAFGEENKFNLPEGMPDIKDKNFPTIDSSVTTLAFEAKRMYVFCRKDLKPFKREQLFMELCESLHQSELKVLGHIKSQTLEEMFPNVTEKLLKENGIIQ